MFFFSHTCRTKGKGTSEITQAFPPQGKNRRLQPAEVSEERLHYGGNQQQRARHNHRHGQQVEKARSRQRDRAGTIDATSVHRCTGRHGNYATIFAESLGAEGGIESKLSSFEICSNLSQCGSASIRGRIARDWINGDREVNTTEKPLGSYARMRDPHQHN